MFMESNTPSSDEIKKNQEFLRQNVEGFFKLLEGDDEALKNLQIETKKTGQKNEKNRLRKEIKELKREYATAEKNGSELDAEILTKAKKLHNESEVFCLEIGAWNKLTPKEKKAIENAKKQKNREIALATASASEETVAEPADNPGDIEKNEASEQAVEAEATNPVIENVPVKKVLNYDEEPSEKIETLDLRKKRLEQKLGLAETEFEEAELKYEQKKADNRETFKGLMATLRIKSFGGGQVKAEEEFFRKKMEEKKQIVEDLKKKIQDLEPEQEKEVPNPVFDGFKELGIKKEELEKMDGFENLSEGQKLLVLENLKQLTLGRIQEEAVENVNKDIAGSNILGKIWKNVSKKYHIAKKEKVNAKELMGGGMSVHEETLKQLVAGAKDGPAVEIKDGELEIQYVSGLNNLTPEQEGQVAEFNAVATEFSNIPYEWSLDTASKKEREKYQEVYTRYQRSLESITDIVNKQNKGDKCVTMLYINDVERNIRLNQFLNNNPEIEKQLENIKDDHVWQRSLAEIITERGIYSAAGFAVRSATVSLLGLAGVPLAAAGMGGFLAWRRGKKNLKEKEVMARKGIVDKELEVKDFVDAKYIQESIDYLVVEIERLSKEVWRDSNGKLIEMEPSKQTESEKKREEMLRSLKSHLEDAEKKLTDGTVNFGSSKEKLFNQYELMKTISRGAVFLQMNNLDVNNEKYKKDSDVISKFIEKQNTEYSEARRRYLYETTIRGVTWGASFAAVGWAARHLGDAWFGWGGAHKAVEGGTEKSMESAMTGLGSVDNIQPGSGPAAVAAENMAKSNVVSAAEVGGSGAGGVNHGVDSNPDHSGPMNEPKAPGRTGGGTTKIETDPKNMPDPRGENKFPLEAKSNMPSSPANHSIEAGTGAPTLAHEIFESGEVKISEHSSIEEEIMKKMQALKVSKEDAGKYAHRMVDRLIKESKRLADLDPSGKLKPTTLAQLNKVNPGEILKFNIDPNNLDNSNITNFRGFSAPHTDISPSGGSPINPNISPAMTEQMNQEEISRNYNNQIMGEHAGVPEAKTQAFSSSDGDRLHQGEVKTQAFGTSDGDRFRQAELEKTKMFSASDGDRLHPNAPESHAGAADGDRFHATETRSIEHAGASEGDRFTPTEAKNLEHSGASDGDRFQPTQARSLEHVGASDGDRFNPVELSLLEKANIKKVADIFDDSIFGGNELAKQITQARDMKGANFYRAYREIYAKIIGNTFRENGISALNAGKYLENGYGNNSKIDALIKYNSSIKGYDVEPNVTETMGEWMTRNIDRALGSCGIGLNNTRFKN
jgi:hypothetical protein